MHYKNLKRSWQFTLLIEQHWQYRILVFWKTENRI